MTKAVPLTLAFQIFSHFPVALAPSSKKVVSGRKDLLTSHELQIKKGRSRLGPEEQLLSFQEGYNVLSKVSQICDLGCDFKCNSIPRSVGNLVGGTSS